MLSPDCPSGQLDQEPGPPLRRYAEITEHLSTIRPKTRSHDDEDAIQTVALTLFQSTERQLSRVRNLLALIHRMFRWVVFKRCRAATRLREVTLDSEEILASITEEPTATTERAEVAAVIALKINAMGEPDRSILIRRCLMKDECSFRDILGRTAHPRSARTFRDSYNAAVRRALIELRDVAPQERKLVLRLALEMVSAEVQAREGADLTA